MRQKLPQSLKILLYIWKPLISLQTALKCEIIQLDEYQNDIKRDNIMLTFYMEY